MLIHAFSQPRIPTGFCCVGSSAVRGRAVVRARRVAGSRRTSTGRDQCLGQPLAPGLDRGRAAGPERRGTRGTQAALRCRRLGDGGARVVGRTGGAGIQYRLVDVAARRDRHQTRDRGRAPSWPRLARAAEVGVVAAAPGASRPGARRGGDRAMEDQAVDAAKKTPGGGAPGSSSKTRAASPSNPLSAAPGRRAARRRS